MAASNLPEQHMTAVKRRLVHLAGLSAKTEAVERRILDAASERRDAVERELGELRPRVMLDQAAQDRHQALILERGQLDAVIATAQETLGK